MTEEHRRFQGWTASYVLGALDGEDRRAFESHLGHCTTCTAELNEFAPVPSLLAKVDPEAVARQPDPALQARIAAEARKELTRLRSGQRVWRGATLAATAAAAILASLLVIDRDQVDQPPEQLTATVISSSAAETNVIVVPKGWGTEIVLNIADLPRREGYQLWTIDDSGEWTNAASWSPTQSGGVRLTGASRIPLDQVDRIVITSLDRADVLVEASG